MGSHITFARANNEPFPLPIARYGAHPLGRRNGRNQSPIPLGPSISSCAALSLLRLQLCGLAPAETPLRSLKRTSAKGASRRRRSCRLRRSRRARSRRRRPGGARGKTRKEGGSATAQRPKENCAFLSESKREKDTTVAQHDALGEQRGRTHAEDRLLVFSERERPHAAKLMDSFHNNLRGERWETQYEEIKPARARTCESEPVR